MLRKAMIYLCFLYAAETYLGESPYLLGPGLLSSRQNTMTTSETILQRVPTVLIMARSPMLFSNAPVMASKSPYCAKSMTSCMAGEKAVNSWLTIPSP